MCDIITRSDSQINMYILVLLSVMTFQQIRGVILIVMPWGVETMKFVHAGASKIKCLNVSVERLHLRNMEHNVQFKLPFEQKASKVFIWLARQMLSVRLFSEMYFSPKVSELDSGLIQFNFELCHQELHFCGKLGPLCSNNFLTLNWIF